MMNRVFHRAALMVLAACVALIATSVAAEIQTPANSVPLVVAVGEKSFFIALLPTFVDGYRAKGMTHVEGAQIPDAGHYLLADNPKAVADLIERHAGRGAR